VARQSPAAATGKQPKENFGELDLKNRFGRINYAWAGRKTLVHRTAGNFPAIFDSVLA
jgi:hypothetical protein